MPNDGTKGPPSVVIVVAALSKGRATLKDLVATTGLGRRTVYAALDRLARDDRIERRVSLRDTRMTYFSLKQKVAG